MRKAIINKYGSRLTFFANGLNILNFLLSFFGFIPQAIKSNNIFKLFSIALLIIGIMLLLRFLLVVLKTKSLTVKILWCGLAMAFFGVLIIVTILQQNLQATQEPMLSKLENIINQKQQNSLVNTTEAKDSANHNHIINGNNNVVDINGDVNYFTTKQISRKLNPMDIKLILASIPSKNYLVRINYPSNNQEAENFGKQIINRLFQLGYSNISESNISNSHEYFIAAERISVKIDSFPVPAVRLIVNPQQ
ncbi:MAG: hypothetical protein E6H09_11165 [Bacteroidetes bacterium]|jgi:hypothetical protein|nr:MAG: hypothetical protein E6H09_11165 [Bacteroidota bacterium]